jgi:hypothetical protein
VIMQLSRSPDTRERWLTGELRGILEYAVSSLDKELDKLKGSRQKMARLLEETRVCKSCGSADCRVCGNLAKLRTLGLLDPNAVEFRRLSIEEDEEV